MSRSGVVAFLGLLLVGAAASGCTVARADSLPLTVYADGVSVASKASSFTPAHSGSGVNAGARIRTDASGFAAVELTLRATVRLASSSDVQVDHVDGRAVALRVNHGQSWHRVAGDASGGATATTYAVTSPVAKYTTTSATFLLRCTDPSSCTLVVVTGSVVVTPDGGAPVTVGAMQSLTVPGNTAAPEPGIHPAGALYADTWTATNLAIDQRDGHASDAPVAATPPQSTVDAAILAGTWSVDMVVTQSTDATDPVGTKSHRDWSFGDADCRQAACRVHLTRTFGPIGEPADGSTTEDLDYTARGFRAHYEYLGPCTSASGDVIAADYFHQTNTVQLHVASVEVHSGVPVAMRLEGTATSQTTLAGKPNVPECFVNSPDPVAQSVAAARVGSAELPTLPQAPTPQPAPAERATSATLSKTTTSLADSADAPSVLSQLTTAQNVDASMAKIAVTAVVVLILLLIVGYPAQLLNATISKNHARIFRWAPSVKRRLLPGSDRLKPVPRRPGLAVGLAAASVIAAFVDPSFGFNLASGRMLGSVAVSFVVESLFAWLLVAAIVRRWQPESTPHVRFRYPSLVIVVAAVLFSRITGFAPGMVFGLVVGLTLGVVLAKAQQARLAIVGLGYVAAVSVVSWLLYSILTPAFGDTPGTVGVFILESLSAFAIGGFAALPITLLPLAVFDGGKLFAWHKAVWAAAYAVSLFIFLLVLLPLPSSWGSTSTPLTSWVAIYVAFSGAAVALWAYFRFVSPRDAAPDTA